VHCFAALGAIALVLEIFNELFPKQITFRGLPLGFLVLVLSIIYGLVQSWPRPLEQSYSSPNTTIRIVKVISSPSKPTS
jgi:hypothetical protein